MTNTSPEPAPVADSPLPTANQDGNRKPKRRRKTPSQFWVFVLGVLAGTIPAAVSSWMQAGAQERQLLLDRKIAAMHSYLVACNRSASPYSYPSEILLEPDERSQALADRVVMRQQREHLYERYGELRSQEALVAALFRIKQDSLGLPSGVPPNIKAMTIKEFDEWFSQRSGAAQMRCSEVGRVLGQRLLAQVDAEPITLSSAAGPPVVPESPRSWQGTPSPTAIRKP
jgi:hypothetical protein